MPCQRDSLPLMRDGMVRMAMTANITGMSTTREAFIPLMVFSTGMAKGEMVMAAPDTSTMLKRFAPMMLPSERALCPLMRAVMAVTSSGREVPRATMVRPMTEDGTPSASAIRVPLFTSRFAPKAISTAPTTSRAISCQTGFSFSSEELSEASAASGFFFICRTVIMI